MKLVFLDTNIVIDLLADRKPFSLFAAKLFQFSLSGTIKIYVSAVSYNNIYYILRQSKPNAETIQLLAQLSALTEITDVTRSIIQDALKTDFTDFEDAIQYYCALSIASLDFIVTRNTKDFIKSVLPVMTPESAVSFLENAGS